MVNNICSAHTALSWAPYNYRERFSAPLAEALRLRRSHQANWKDSSCPCKTDCKAKVAWAAEASEDKAQIVPKKDPSGHSCPADSKSWECSLLCLCILRHIFNTLRHSELVHQTSLWLGKWDTELRCTLCCLWTLRDERNTGTLSLRFDFHSTTFQLCPFSGVRAPSIGLLSTFGWKRPVPSFAILADAARDAGRHGEILLQRWKRVYGEQQCWWLFTEDPSSWHLAKSGSSVNK